MARYNEEERLDYVRQASQAAVQYIREAAGISESRAQDWIQKYWLSIRKPYRFGQLAKQKNELKIEQRKFKDLEKRLEVCQQLLLDGCSNDRKRRRELARKAVNRYGHSIARACEVLSISQGYYRDGGDE